MTRASQTVSVGLLVSALYLATLYNLIPILPSKVQDEILPVLPLWALVSFGAYLLGKIGFALVTFNDVPDAHKRLMKEIETARGELRGWGVDVD
ncbi:MAG: hypothetical protein M1828_006145 [Chrysothrix sp. TS-e1954]|nr:MAG: hypothetical protein M1828_006145 [Chrysothrix sp. TS-e1954]